MRIRPKSKTCSPSAEGVCGTTKVCRWPKGRWPVYVAPRSDILPSFSKIYVYSFDLHFDRDPAAATTTQLTGRSTLSPPCHSLQSRGIPAGGALLSSPLSLR